MRKRLTVFTVGCKASFADSAGIVREAAAAGFEVVAAGQPADVVFISGCTVTNRADRDNRAVARRVRRAQPGAVLVMSGCFPATAGAEARKDLPEVDHWIDSPDTETGPLLRRLAGDDGSSGREITDYAADLVLGHKRTFLKIQDGCDCRCAYCVVPLARGAHRSRPTDEIVARAVASERDGATEFLLTGIHIGRFGSDRGEEDGLAKLVRALLSATGRPRIRLGSVEPMELSHALLSLFRETDRLCPHLHVPLQSGSDAVLRRMRRPYGSSGFLDAVRRARDAMPSGRIGSDVLAGFPGESEDDFRATVDAVEASGIDYLHVFPYSARPGTESSLWADDVPSRKKKERVEMLNRVNRRLHDAFLARQAGRAVTVLAQRHDPSRGVLTGICELGVDVEFEGSPADLCRMVPVRVDSVAGDRLSGRGVSTHA